MPTFYGINVFSKDTSRRLHLSHTLQALHCKPTLLFNDCGLLGSLEAKHLMNSVLTDTAESFWAPERASDQQSSTSNTDNIGYVSLSGRFLYMRESFLTKASLHDIPRIDKDNNTNLSFDSFNNSGSVSVDFEREGFD